MTWAITAIAVYAVGTTYTAYQQREAGKQQQYNLERQSEQEALSAQTEELKRRERLNQVLSANIREAAASGISGEGSHQSLALQGAKRAGSSEGVESLSDRLRKDLLRREGKASRMSGNVQAASTLLSGASGLASLSASPSK